MNVIGEPPELHYHYTTASALMSILESGELWATDLRFLNDARELTLAMDLLTEEFERLRRSGSQPGGLRRADEPVTATVRELVERNLANMLAEFRCYVTCFCADGDLLSQWRGYAPGQTSVASHARLVGQKPVRVYDCRRPAEANC